MFDLYYWPTPNGHKVTIFLEEAKLSYKLFPIEIRAGQQFSPEFLKISPNNKIPALVDHQPADGGKPLTVFESGAILLYLADKVKQFISPELRSRTETIQWLFWQMAGLGPMAGQNHHFTQYAAEVVPYAIDRYVNETKRLYTVLNNRLADREYIAKEYSIADMACYPWILLHEKQKQNLNDFLHIKRWFENIKERDGVKRAYQRADEFNPDREMTDEVRKILFGTREEK